MMSRILIIEDDMDLQEGLAYFLEKDGSDRRDEKSGDGDHTQSTVRPYPA